MPQQPLPIGTRVRHYSQQWTHARRVGTGTIIDSKGPWPDGSCEYLVRTAEDFSRRSSKDNPETSERWWASHTTIPVNRTEEA